MIRANDNEDDDESKRLKSEDLSLTAGATVTEVGSTTPVEDFEQLLKDGEAIVSGTIETNYN